MCPGSLAQGAVGRRRIVGEPQDAVAQGSLVGEPLSWQLQSQRHGLQKLAAQAVEGAEEPAQVLAEPRGRARPDVVVHVLAIAVARGQLAPHVPEFLQVGPSAPLGGLDAEGPT